MGSLRTPEMTQRYKDYRDQGGLENGCRLCDSEPIKKYRFWKITDNKFPFDRIAKVHYMLMPLRHTTEAGFTEEERFELFEIKHGVDIQDDYDFIIEAMHKKKSIPDHFHLHLIVAKDFEQK